jgi:hypothetical protein
MTITATDMSIGAIGCELCFEEHVAITPERTTNLGRIDVQKPFQAGQDNVAGGGTRSRKSQNSVPNYRLCERFRL